MCPFYRRNRKGKRISGVRDIIKLIQRTGNTKRPEKFKNKSKTCGVMCLKNTGISTFL